LNHYFCWLNLKSEFIGGIRDELTILLFGKDVTCSVQNFKTNFFENEISTTHFCVVNQFLASFEDLFTHATSPCKRYLNRVKLKHL